jgi:transcriptional regulator with XRE-family HTH domain
MIESTDIIYAHKLRHLRFSKHYKQEAVAKMLGLKSQQEYSNLENGKVNFTDEIIANICRSFEITEEEFARPTESIHVSDSPNSNISSSNNTFNDIKLIDTILQSKDETIAALKEQNVLLKRILQEKGWV